MFSKANNVSYYTVLFVIFAAVTNDQNISKGLFLAVITYEFWVSGSSTFFFHFMV